MNAIRHWLHEQVMRYRIRRILAYNRKHPERCFSFEDFLDKHDLTFTPASDEVTQQTGITGVIESSTLLTSEQYETLREELYRVTRTMPGELTERQH